MRFNLLINDVPNSNNQSFSARFNNPDMKATITNKKVPVSDNEVKPFSSRQNEQKLPSPFVCAICSKSFMGEDNLKQHMVIHSGEKPYVCDICQKAFARKATLS